MKRNDLYSYAYDFVSRLMERPSYGSIRGIILFGSVARGDFDRESDIDIFIDTEKEAEVEGTVKSVLGEFYSHSRHTWVLRGIENRITPLVGNLNDEKWSALKREMISSGLVIYGKYTEMPKKARHQVLIVYEISKLQPKKKSKFLRELIGYRLVRGKKEYNITGLLQRLGGSKISKNVILVPKESQQAAYELLVRYRTGFKMMEVWTDS
ncbi:MAG: nucleotidyltransferase domain-containing protein [Candidatus Aenigmarchaeota archaeon]|nr:nucleotidyltransferase domain-containing protein [Candidatus Aenigmarchaeota archaeon]